MYWTNDKEYEVIMLDNISEDEWNKMRTQTIEMVESKHLDSDPIKCAVSSFLYWLQENDMELVSMEAHGPSEDEQTH